MGLFSKKKKHTEQTPDDVPALGGHGGDPNPNAEETGIKTALSYHPEWELTPQEKYVLQFNHQKLPGLQPNQLSINGINLYEYEDGFVVTAFLQSTLPKPVSFEIMDLVIVDEEGNPLARKSFEMDLFGELPPQTCRPWRFLFNNEDKLAEDIPAKGWKLVFELKQKSLAGLELDLEESWKESLGEEQKNKLQEFVKNLPPLKEGEVNFMGLEARQSENRSIPVTLLVRNASNRSIFLEHLPLALEDASNEIVAQAGFALNNLEVKPHTCKPWTFVFPEEAIKKEQIDLSKWKAYVPNQ
ncbi:MULTISPECIES: accessory Sec system S-layer assembly protein [Bacillaceae]|uniref:accessory Sec system S-layer assembly protein n=1 Tax=Bacillaceae TaxID=186817 RepID=UPI002964F84E|nr:accessory Sec system S-layer assembly protein [Bacillus infantis]MDW2876613.1 accessory Sec system S-layer assembly protein [Bacillus infantis]